ncbi:MAG: adenosylhomocysteinase [Planctomycetes bacterium]|nr:adenosylhomocysteinase [Planctomycetota bacterium]
MHCDIADRSLAPRGRKRILWADADMPVLQRVRERFQAERPLEGVRMSCCLHVTAETANLVRALRSGGAEVVVCASNPLSTQDEVAASLVEDHGVPVHARRGEDTATFYRHLEAALAHSPHITMDDGADLVTAILTKHPELHGQIVASLEETTTGVIRLRAMERDGALRFPVIAVNDAATKHLFDNRYGTGQSTVDGIVRATDLLLAGKVVVTVGYGWCGRGFAGRVRGMGARVIVVEVDPIRALEATMDGFQVMSMRDAARQGEVFCTLTGNKHVIRREHFELMRDGAMICNSGHFDVEIDIPALRALAMEEHRGVREFVDRFDLSDGRRLYLLGEGRLINLAAAHGHPASVMDMSFATQALAAEHAVRHRGELPVRVVDVPREIEEWVARLKLDSMGVTLEELTPEQKKYQSSWEAGT